jgi:hypothetical protein
MNITERKTKIWHGTYRGVAFEINNFKTPPNRFDDYEKDNWTYYLILHLSRIPEENKPNSFWLKAKADEKGRVFYPYHKNHIITNIDFAGGCTWYSKEKGFDGENKVIKIGCDYQHSWDEGREYDLEWVKRDVMNTIDVFLNYVPDYKYWCCGNGKLYSLKDGIVKNGTFYSKEYYGDKEWFRDFEPQL